MNNVLDYRGYRFFQSSYDPDEKGTRLSVNHDYPGTLITYIGYFLLGLGFVLTVMNKNARFTSLISNMKSNIARKSNLTAILVLFAVSSGFALEKGEIDMHGGKEHHNHFMTMIMTMTTIMIITTMTMTMITMIKKMDYTMALQESLSNMRRNLDNFWSKGSMIDMSL